MGAPLVTSTAMIKCSFGAAPATLNATPRPVMVEEKPIAAITDIAPGLNIPPFGLCSSLANPTVAAATSAAMGALTPMPCVPAVAAPWQPGSPTTMVGGIPALTANSMCNCVWGGVINVAMPGALRTTAG
ncbi:MAG TPA: DUF4280 domain-containing protein [Acidimicrobiales bacterium]|jgi:hypothetical protein|nr:DUF4280 domain-containing protein [Acidimicrobiales bacterium]